MESDRGVTTIVGETTNPTQSAALPTVSVAVLGTDVVLAAAPATPVQLAHACLRAGFASVIPASWGDELIAAAVLRRLPHYGTAPVIQCSCPIVAHRLLAASGDLRSMLLPLVPPPVAVARYVRALARPARVRVTYVGSCPGATDDSIDIRMSPDALMAMLAERGIVVVEQPQAFESVIPPDRRRFRSQPGGVPTADALWTELGSRSLVELHDDDFVTELAQHLLSGKNILIDPTVRLGCICAGAAGSIKDPRVRVAALEPPRSPSPIVEERAPIDLDLPIPAVTRTPVEVVAISSTTSAPTFSGAARPTAPPRPTLQAPLVPPAPPQLQAPPPPQERPAAQPIVPPVQPVVTPPSPPPSPRPVSATATPPLTSPAPPSAPAGFSRGQLIVILIAVTAIVICASTVVTLMISRTISAPVR